MKPLSIALLYDEPDPASYEAILLLDGEQTHRFATGEPSQDYVTAFAVAHHLRKPRPETLYHSSSIDHFQMDGGELKLGDWTPEEIAAAKVRAKAYMDGLGEA
ncbi:MAG: hypothetical protein VX899_00620 [Myxococcota bacterium]|nr:hypothetical protein [Myxococcota bacterium]